MRLLWCSSCIQCNHLYALQSGVRPECMKAGGGGQSSHHRCPQDQNAVCTWLPRWNSSPNAGLIGTALSIEALT